ncbi:hypothetical protein B0H13DRAFT_2317440 [Mycena leptocephala]|nr:hypothetical protein B0H13DRAFT_2317440 [Mycena leptocephala]
MAKPEALARIPRIELADMDVLDITRRQILVNQVKDASERLGLFYVKNYCIPENVIERAFACSKEVFSLPLETKMKSHQPDPVKHRGYRPLRSYNLDAGSDGDVVETILIEWEPKDGPPRRKNNWIAAAPEFRSASLDLDSIIMLRDQMYVVLALAIGEGPDFFVEKTKQNQNRLRFMHYPEVTEESNGIGIHSDPPLFTIVCHQPGSRGLQVLTRSNEWIDVPPVPGYFIVNLADQMAALTNDVFRSPPHRVINRPGPDHYSIAFFNSVDMNVALQPLPRFASSTPTSTPEPARTALAQYTDLSTRYLKWYKL